jgi:hypothetical protein
MKTMVRSGRSADTQFVVLAPQQVAVPPTMATIHRDEHIYRSFLADLQRFRGATYLSDGAISRQELTPDGRHVSALDEQSWHVLGVNGRGKVCACLRFSEETGARYEDLWVRQAAVARCPTWGGRFRRAVESQMARAETECLRFGEVGGWAVAQARRCTVEALRIILATYGLLELLGGCIGVATATLRHESAGILRRIGLWPIAVDGLTIPVYYDDRYGCQMEVLEFDSRHPNTRYKTWMLQLRSHLKMVPVICGE